MRYLTFRLGAEEYGVNILCVQEIRSYEKPTRIPGAPTHMLGVINLRGTIVPVVDMRLKMGCERIEYSGLTVVVVLKVAGRVVGLVVDAVSDVQEIERGTIHPPPDVEVHAIAQEAIVGIASIEQRMLILLDIEKLFAEGGMGLVESSAEPEHAV